MKVNTASVGLLAMALLGLDGGASQTGPVTAPAGEPQLVETGGGAVMFTMTEAEYQKLAARMAESPMFVAMRKKPAKLSARAVFGFNFVLGGRNLSWALDGDDKDGYSLYADLDGDGDLDNDAPVRFEHKDGKYSVRIEAIAREKTKDGVTPYPVVFKLVVDRVAPPSGEPKLAILRFDRTVRRGALPLSPKPGAATTMFRISGAAGTYDEGYLYVAFDLNGNAAFDWETESFQISEKYVNIGDTSYEFAVDRYGRSVTLTPLPEKRTARPVLVAGHPAPDFSFVDIEGRSRKLSDYRGKVVLLDFWGTWCGPCIAAAPELVATYEELRTRGFEIIGIDSGDTKEKLRAFLTDKKMSWVQTMEAQKGPIHSLYRISGWPYYYVIGKDGAIGFAGSGASVSDLKSEVEKLLNRQ